jgi:hypothetical protein
LAALHLFRELGHAALEFVGVAEEIEFIHRAPDPTQAQVDSRR